MSERAALLRLIDALAARDAEDYLREQTEESGAANDPTENPVLPDTGKAA